MCWNRMWDVHRRRCWMSKTGAGSLDGNVRSAEKKTTRTHKVEMTHPHCFTVSPHSLPMHAHTHTSPWKLIKELLVCKKKRGDWQSVRKKSEGQQETNLWEKRNPERFEGAGRLKNNLSHEIWGTGYTKGGISPKHNNKKANTHVTGA